MAIGGSYYDESYQFEERGVSGFRSGISYLTHHNGYEQGVYVGLGTLNYASSFIIGHDIRKITERKGQLWRYSLYSEMNILRDDRDDSGWGSSASGTVFQFRPAVTSVTSETKKYYGGVHGILGFGTIDRSRWDWDYEQRFSYDLSTLGIGLTAGHEQRLMNFIIQSQFDVSLVNHMSSLISLDNSGWDDDGFSPLDQSSLHLGIGMSIYPAPRKQSGKKTKQKVPTGFVPPVADKQEQVYDPFTGQLVDVKEEKPVPMFDPETGEVIPPSEVVEFDPLTGEQVKKEAPLTFDPLTGEPIKVKEPTPRDPKSSLLSIEEQTSLVAKGLKILSINGMNVHADVVDLNDLGIMTINMRVRPHKEETIYYDRIRSISFGSPSSGFSGAKSGAMMGTMGGLAIPIGLAAISQEPEYLFLSILTAPAGAVGGFIYGFASRETHTLEFRNVVEPRLSKKQLRLKKKQMILEMMKEYIANGFP